QRLADAAPVLEKARGRWRLTELGRQVNRWSRAAIVEQERMLGQHGALRLGGGEPPAWLEGAALVLVGVQRGFDEPAWGRRNNPRAEAQIKALLEAWRAGGREVVHVRHHSRLPASPLRAGAPGAAFKDFAEPRPGELVVTKAGNSAFAGTELEAELRGRGATALVLAGFTSNHCVDATARQGSDLGFRVFVAGDACAAFDRAGPDGKLVAAEDLHAVSLANLHQEFAVVLSTAELLAPPRALAEP
ncbi:MAG TPA: cysteine hydrolase family protein, partial [Polyangiaceae bacterium]|nr:cysteine hydrolase family protein [Polyangiaceae bacterium]